MSVYAETVRLLTRPWQAVNIALGVLGIGVTGYLFWFFFLRDDYLSAGWLLILLLLYFPFHLALFLQCLHGGVYSRMRLDVTSDSVVLRRGLLRRKLALADIVDVKALNAGDLQRVFVERAFPFSLRHSFLERRCTSTMKVVLTGGDTRFFATGKPLELTEFLRQRAEEAKRSGALRSIPF